MRLRRGERKERKRTSDNTSVAVIASDPPSLAARATERVRVRRSGERVGGSEAISITHACAMKRDCFASLAMTQSNGHVRLALADAGRRERLLGESLLLGQDERRRAHALRLLLEAGRTATLLHRLRGFAQTQARHDDRIVGRYQVL